MPRAIVASTALVLALAAAPAGAHVAHTVAPGETLWSIAAASNLTTRALAAANGLSPDAQVVLGSTVWVPSEAEAAAALAGGGPVGGSAARGSGSAGGSGPAAAAAPPALGGYLVRPGDTLSGLAARGRVPAAQIAHMNGLRPDAWLLAGTHLKLPTGAPGSAGASPAPASGATPSGAAPPAPSGSAPAAPAAASAPAPATQSAAPAAPPQPAPGRVTASEIGSIAAQHGVPGSLATAIAWQESGFNNAMVSSANARGVMQILPGTWDWVEQNLARRRLDASSPAENVHAGVLYLGQLLRDTGGDPAAAAAAYYQGLGALRSRGMLPETQRYVANVLALRARFGAP